ncbi:two-component sensor histidine kinase [Pseudomonas tolaasii]|uniref:histidine kinase n=2 Tax=Pseudomonas tolaasii TaxID=29442 RepID=A0A7Y8DRT8_PSETO|nr:ATP-binding protein [Pseudomonas tolaasii]ARB27505.1 two-component sensor histidine kinase [Pseudomonas tolaasii]KAB0475375.1 two-component sensor histidine kinase [Pseudomonas tolaasii]MBY8941987.1 two-component sensor histidine kinase [Pseudomonas tolaasii]NWC23062.1 two-component sensor histidine kinase [Pseudomonas tolaasii]NWC39812.1 two-component sensor histidine kinase [Pseudomonas tolaasii]
MLSKVRPWMVAVAATGWAGLTLYLLWLCANASVFVGQDSFLRLMAGPGYLVAEQLKGVPADQREARMRTLRAHFQYPVHLVTLDEVVLPPEALVMLEHRQPALNSDEDVSYFPLDDKTLIQFGPMWGTAEVKDLLKFPVYWLTAAVAGLPVLLLIGLGIRTHRRRRRDLNTLNGCLATLARTPNAMLPAMGKEWTPLLLTLQQHAQDISAMNDRHREVSQAVSHELRTPLARMRFALTLLGKSEDPLTRTRLQERLQTDVEELEALVRASLAFARLASAPTDLQYEPIDLRDWLHHEFALLDDHHRRLSLDTEPANLELVGDRALLHLIVRNLLSNAITYARDQVSVSATYHGEHHVVLHVDDDGPGVLAENREKIFEPFVRLSMGGDEPGGFGLGLALAKRATQWHRGELSVTRSPLGGARMSLVLPLRPR